MLRKPNTPNTAHTSRPRCSGDAAPDMYEAAIASASIQALMLAYCSATDCQTDNGASTCRSLSAALRPIFAASHSR